MNIKRHLKVKLKRLLLLNISKNAKIKISQRDFTINLILFLRFTSFYLYATF